MRFLISGHCLVCLVAGYFLQRCGMAYHFLDRISFSHLAKNYVISTALISFSRQAATALIRMITTFLCLKIPLIHRSIIESRQFSRRKSMQTTSITPHLRISLNRCGRSKISTNKVSVLSLHELTRLFSGQLSIILC